MESCIIEMLIILNKKSNIGQSPSTFKKILEATDEIIINDNSLCFEGMDFSFLIVEHGKNDDTLLIKLELKEINDSNLLKFTKLIRLFKKISTENKLGNIQIIWDDISKYYSVIAYPMIHEIENLMRKLITKFMLHNVGLSWTKKSIPEEFARSLDKSNKLNTQNELDKQNEHNIMYQVDFIQLSNFLFNAYRELEVAELIKKLTPLSFQDLDENAFSELKKIIPQTNWSKYFESSIDISANSIISDWRILYELRCCVAHNRDFTKKDLDDVIKLTDKLKPILKNAIEKTENIIVNTKDKNDLVNQFEESFIDNNKTDIEIFRDSVINLFLKTRQLYELAFGVPNSGNENFKKVVNDVFEKVLNNEKYTAEDAISLIDIALDQENINKYDNFELHDMSERSNFISKIIMDKMASIEIALDGPDSYE